MCNLTRCKLVKPLLSDNGHKAPYARCQELKSHGTKGSLSKMNLTKLKELHQKVMAESGQSNDENAVTVSGTGKQRTVLFHQPHVDPISHV